MSNVNPIEFLDQIGSSYSLNLLVKQTQIYHIGLDYLPTLPTELS